MRVSRIFIATILIGLFLPTAAFAVGNFDDEGGSMSFDTGVPQYQDSLIAYCDFASNSASRCLDAYGISQSSPTPPGNILFGTTSDAYTIISYSVESPGINGALTLTCDGHDLAADLFGPTEQFSLWGMLEKVFQNNDPFFTYHIDTPVHCIGPLIAGDEDGNSYVWVQIVPYDTRLKISPAVAPSLAAPSSSVTSVSATLDARIAADGGASSTARGFLWGTTSAYGNMTTQSGIFGAGPFSTVLSGLACDTVYHYSAYGVNRAGTSTTPDSTFTTSPCSFASSSSKPSVSSSGSSVSASQLAALLVPSPATTAYLSSRNIQAPIGDTLAGCPRGMTCAPVSAQTATSGASSFFFAHDLRLGAVSADVKALQQYLNSHGYIVAARGPGSFGNETTTFGALTKIVLMKFQKKNNIPHSGFFGPKTRKYINSQVQ